MEHTEEDDHTAWRPGLHLFCNDQEFCDYIDTHGGKKAADIARKARTESNAIIKKMIG